MDSKKKTTMKSKRKTKRPYRYKPGTRSLMEIKKYQKSVDLLIPLLPFKRLVREIANGYKSDLRITKKAFNTLQESTESYLVDLFKKTNKIAIHCNKRITIMPKDIKLKLELDK